MSTTNRTREHVERGIWKRTGADGRTRFEITYRDSEGRQRRQVVEGGVKAARTALADVKSKMGHGQRVTPQPRLTFAAAAERWRASQEGALRPKTLATYDSHLRTHLLPRWGNRRLDSLDVDAVARLVEELRASGRKGWTQRGVLVVAGLVFGFAQRRLGYAGENPVRLLERKERPHSDQRERRILSGDELTRLLDATGEGDRSADYRPLFTFAASTGARLGEVLGLRWRDVDLDEGTATITHQLDRRHKRVPLKTPRSRRTIELPGSLVQVLREHRLRSAHAKADDYLFCSKGGRPLDHRNVAGRVLARGLLSAEIERPWPTFHDLRHGFASAWIASGGDLVELSAHLGHADPAVTARFYSHEFERARRSDARRDRLDAIYGSDVAASERRSRFRAKGRKWPICRHGARGRSRPQRTGLPYKQEVACSSQAPPIREALRDRGAAFVALYTLSARCRLC